jgi:hypothetical protein
MIVLNPRMIAATVLKNDQFNRKKTFAKSSCQFLIGPAK